MTLVEIFQKSDWWPRVEFICLAPSWRSLRMTCMMKYAALGFVACSLRYDVCNILTAAFHFELGRM